MQRSELAKPRTTTGLHGTGVQQRHQVAGMKERQWWTNAPLVPSVLEADFMAPNSVNPWVFGQRGWSGKKDLRGKTPANETTWDLRQLKKKKSLTLCVSYTDEAG